MSITCFSDEVKLEFKDNCIQSDWLLFDIVKQNRKPTHAETVFFQQKMGWDQKAVNDQIRRAGNVLRLQTIAGSPATREATKTEAEKAAEISERKGPKLLEQEAKLRAEREGLERDARRAAKRSEEQSEAVLQLRKLNREDIQKEADFHINTTKATIGKAISDREIRLNELECVLDPSRYRDEQTHLESLQRSFPAAVIIGSGHGHIKRALSPEWPTIRGGIQNELATLQLEIEPLRAEYKSSMEAAEQMQDYYSDPKNQQNE